MLWPSTHRQRGTSLIETLIATAMCMIAVFALAGLVSMSIRQSKDMGWTVAQATALGGQKMDHLMGLPFAAAALNAGGDLAANDTGYADCLDPAGVVVSCGGTGVFFTRRWLIEDFSTTLKRITLRVEGRPIGRGIETAAASTAAPSATLACLKASPIPPP